jgi:mono/diheme cytochrome c family protein
MQRFIRWAGAAVAVVVALALTVLAIVYGGAEAKMARRYEAPATTLVAAQGPEAVARGARLAQIYGCRDCHADNLQGALFHDEPMLARLRAPNLTRVAASWSDADLDRALRHGVRPNGRALWVMPSAAFSRMDDAEAADVLAFLRAHPAAGPERARSSIGPLGRLGILLGKFRSEPETLATRGRELPIDLGAEHARGRHLAMVACGECHGPALTGGPQVKAPDLAIAASYDRPAFVRLMRTGLAADGKPRGLMSAAARARFSHFTDEEIGQVHAYLTARAERTP